MNRQHELKSAGDSTSRPPVSDALISVVLPVYNESGVVWELAQRIRESLTLCRTTFEIIFVNDGSTDGTAECLDRLSSQFDDVRVLHLSRNFGHQAAIQAGLSQARGDAVVLMDSDLQDPPEAIGKFLAAWQDGYDVAYAIRVGRKENIAKRAMFAAFHRLLSSISRTPMPLDAGNFSLMDARVVRTILALIESDRYLPGLRSWVGFKQVGILIERGWRYDRQPRVSLLGLIRLAKTAVFSFSSLPLAVFSWLGWIAFAAFLGVSGYSVYCRFFTDTAVPGWTSQLVSMSFFAALNALGISMLGEYVVRIYDQVRSRPTYLVDRTVNCPIAAEVVCTQPAPASGSRPAPILGLDQFDPLELDNFSNDAYQYLLEQANDLLELGSLAQIGREENPSEAAPDLLSFPGPRQ